jgi:hypothetical protein
MHLAAETRRPLPPAKTGVVSLIGVTVGILRAGRDRDRVM